MLPATIKIVCNPYRGVITDEDFGELVTVAVRDLALRIQAGCTAGRKGYTRDSFAVVVLDPTAPRSQASADSVMFTALIGPDGESFLTNAAAKAYDTRDLPVEIGQAVYTAKHLRRGGSFRYGFAPVALRGIFVGGSGQSEAVDLAETNKLGMEFDRGIGLVFDMWEEQHPEGRWFNDDDTPNPLYASVHDLDGTIIELSASEATYSTSHWS